MNITWWYTSSYHSTLTLLIIFITFLSGKMGSCTDQWWSTEQCWDHWREWSLYWLKTLEGNGEKMIIITWSQMHFITLLWYWNCILAHYHSFLSPRPLWLSPAQVIVIPVGGNSESYAKQVSPWWFPCSTSADKVYFFFWLSLLIC